MEDWTALQPDVNPRMRAILLEWLFKVAEREEVQVDTVLRGIILLDKFLARQQVSRTKLQLLGCACFWIAVKLDIDTLVADRLVYWSAGAFTKAELIDMERQVVRVLSWELLSPPT